MSQFAAAQPCCTSFNDVDRPQHSLRRDWLLPFTYYGGGIAERTIYQLIPFRRSWSGGREMKRRLQFLPRSEADSQRRTESWGRASSDCYCC